MWSELFSYLEGVGVKSIFFESFLTEKHLVQPNVDCYIASKLMWNPGLDVNAIREEYFRLYYGVASPFVYEAASRFEAHYAYEVMENGLHYRQNDQDERLKVKYHPYGFLKSQFDLVTEGLAAIQSAQLPELEKEKLIHRVKEYRLMPYYMLLLFYDNYFPGDNIGKMLYAKSFFDDCDEVGIKSVCGYWSIDAIKKSYGF